MKSSGSDRDRLFSIASYRIGKGRIRRRCIEGGASKALTTAARMIVLLNSAKPFSAFSSLCGKADRESRAVFLRSSRSKPCV
jgi:hypothetical protein